MTRLIASLSAALGLLLGLIAIDYATLGGVVAGQIFVLDTVMQLQALGIAALICFALCLSLLAIDLHGRMVDYINTNTQVNQSQLRLLARLDQANQQEAVSYAITGSSALTGKIDDTDEARQFIDFWQGDINTEDTP